MSNSDLRLRNHFEKFPHSERLIAVSPIIKIDIAGSALIVEFIEEQGVFFRYMADQNITAERNSHSIAGEIVGSDLLFRLEFDSGNEMSVVQADFFGAGASVISAL